MHFTWTSDETFERGNVVAGNSESGLSWVEESAGDEDKLLEDVCGVDRESDGMDFSSSDSSDCDAEDPEVSDGPKSGERLGVRSLCTCCRSRSSLTRSLRGACLLMYFGLTFSSSSSEPLTYPSRFSQFQK